MARKKSTKADAEPKRPTGRPTKYKRETVDIMLERFEDGERLRPICRDMGVAIGTFLGWAYDNRDGLSERYSRAQVLNAMALAEETFEIADDGTNDFEERLNRDGSTYIALRDEHVRRSVLRVNTRQWYIEKVLAGTIRLKRETSGDEGSQVAEKALAALERIASEKAALAKPANISR